MLRHLLPLFCIALMATGCATLPEGPTENVDLPSQIKRINDINNWQINGKLAVREGKRGNSASMVWQQNDGKASFVLTNMLGITLANMQIDGATARLEADGETYSGTNPDFLIEQVTGMVIPVNRLSRWVKGVPFVDDKYQLNDKGLVKTLLPVCATCAQWNVGYDNYGEVDAQGESVWLPHSITLTRPYQPNSFIKIRISQWTIK